MTNLWNKMSNKHFFPRQTHNARLSQKELKRTKKVSEKKLQEKNQLLMPRRLDEWYTFKELLRVIYIARKRTWKLRNSRLLLRNWTRQIYW